MPDISLKYFDKQSPINADLGEKEVIEFLFQHLENFGDPKDQIQKCLDYAMGRAGKEGGFLLMAFYKGELAGASIINYTGMEGYIPANILVYIAVDASYRGKGIGASIIENVIERCEGGIALHVEPENDAKRLYERMGFTNKYLEMRHA
jgi:GNAT superfamily N-acetyltransferase